VRHPHHYNPNQPRVPKGHPTGGQWTDGNHGPATILEEGGQARSRYGQDTILQPPRQADDEEPPVQLALLQPVLRRAARITLRGIAGQQAAREAAIKNGLAWFSALSALNSPDERAVIEFEAHQYERGKENTLEYTNLGILTREEFEKMCKHLGHVQDFVDQAAEEANRKHGLTPQTYGTEVHKGLEARINHARINKKGFETLWAERSAVKSTAALPQGIQDYIKLHGAAPPGYPETVRTDGFEYFGQGTVCVYDAKTGDAKFPQSRMRTLVDAIFSTDEVVPALDRMAEITAKIATWGLPVQRVIMMMVRPTVPRVLKPAQ
jgi:hypothetical protein